MNTLIKIVDLNQLFGKSSELVYKCINYWCKQVCDEMKFKYPKEIINIEYKIINSITSIEIDFAINDSKFVYGIELNLNIALFIVEDECLFIDFQNNIMIEWYKFMHFGRYAMTNATTYVVSLLDKQFYEELIEDTVERINKYGNRED